MLLVTVQGEYLGNTGKSDAIRTKDEALAWAYLYLVKDPSVTLADVGGVWLDDSDPLVDEIIANGSRVNVVDGVVTLADPPPPPPVNVDALKFELGRLLNVKAAQVELGEDATGTQAQIDAIKVEIMAAA